MALRPFPTEEQTDHSVAAKSFVSNPLVSRRAAWAGDVSRRTSPSQISRRMSEPTEPSAPGLGRVALERVRVRVRGVDAVRPDVRGRADVERAVVRLGV